MMPALLAGSSFSDARVRARALLAEVGLDHRETHKPRQLSGGEQQRVAVARALMNEPLVLLADEPSGNLDASTSLKLHELLFGLREKRQLSLIVVTHNGDLAARADRILVLEQGRLQPTARV
jgi:lipoprotein-releasing system ATP-binding protein